VSVLFLRFYVNILCLLIGFVYFSEFNKENKIDQHAKSSVSGIGFEVDEEDPKFLEDLHESDEEEEKGDDFEVGDEYDSSNPTIIAHSEANKDALNHVAVEEFIKQVILPRKLKSGKDPNVTLAKLVDKFWEERHNFVKRRGFFSQGSIWITPCDPRTVSYEWHKRYSLPASEVFDLSACLTCTRV